MYTHNVFLKRRDLLLGNAAALLALQRGEEELAFADYTTAFRVEAQGGSPRIKCFDLRRLTGRHTPAGEFFEFHQTSAPAIDLVKWRLRISGFVERPAEFSIDDLTRRADVRDVAVTMECSGNSGQPQLMNGLVSSAVWTGVPLRDVLNVCGVQSEAREVVFLGADSEFEKKWQAGDAEFASAHGRSIFVQDALDSGPLLAFRMNGERLPVQHGAPLRLVMPGWYGMANVKWLTRIHVLDRRYEGRQMSRNYHGLHAADGAWMDTSISRMRLKSVVARVTKRRVGDAYEYRVSGAAWGGSSRITAVEVRVDREEWRAARIGEPGGSAEWVLWTFEWSGAAPGRHTLACRARNAAGEVQPTREEWRRATASNREDNSQWPRIVVI